MTQVAVDQLDQAREAIGKTFAALDIGRVVCVDDSNAASLNYVLELAAFLSPQDLASVPEFVGVPFDIGDSRALLEQQWSRLEIPAQRQAYKRLCELVAAVPPEEASI